MKKHFDIIVTYTYRTVPARFQLKEQWPDNFVATYLQNNDDGYVFKALFTFPTADEALIFALLSKGEWDYVEEDEYERLLANASKTTDAVVW